MRIAPWVLTLCLTQCSSPQPPQNRVSSKVQVHRQAIRKVITSHRRYISHCYGQSLLQKGHEHLQGTLMTSFDIGPDGKAVQAKILKEKSTIYSRALSQCILTGIQSWDFPVHPQGEWATIRYPFVFKASPPPNMQKKLDRFQNLKKTQL